MSAAIPPSNRRLRLLHLIASVDPRGGGPIEGLIRQEEVTRARAAKEVVSLDPPDAAFVRDFPFKIHALGDGRSRPPPLRAIGYTPHLVPWLRSHVADYDAVIVNGLWNYAAVGGARALPGGSTPYYVFPHGMLDPWFRETKPFKHWVKQASWLAFEGLLLAGAEAVLFTSEEERRRAEGQFLGHRYRSKVVAYGAADVGGDATHQRQAFAEACPRLAGRPYLLFLSRIHPKKGCDILIRAFAGLVKAEPDLQLVMAGPDQDGWGVALRQEALGLGVSERIHWPSMLVGDAKWGAFRGAEAFILPSHQENFGIAVAESLACSTPVLISDKVNIWREVEASGAGLVAPDDQEGVSALLARWTALPSAARQRMRLAARGCFEMQFDVRAAAADMLNRIEREIGGAFLAG